MSKREKALDLFNKFYYTLDVSDEYKTEEELAKKCAIISTKNTMQILINSLNYEQKTYDIISRSTVKQLQEQEDILEELEKL
jgi:hypothetical protein